MTQPSTLLLAKQGDPEAIATLMNTTLQPRGITAKAAVQAGALHVVLTCDRPLNQQVLVDFTKKGLEKLEVSAFPWVQIAAYQTGVDAPLWLAEIPQFVAIAEVAERPEGTAVAGTEAAPPANQMQPPAVAVPQPARHPGPWPPSDPDTGKSRRSLFRRRSRVLLWGCLVACISFAAGGFGAFFAREGWLDGPLTSLLALLNPAGGRGDGTAAPPRTPAQQQQEAKDYLTQMNQAQQLFYEQNGRFAASLEELERSASIMARSYGYSYTLTAPDAKQAQLIGIPKVEGLRSFRAIVQVFEPAAGPIVGKSNPDKSNPDKSNPDKSNPDKSNPEKSKPAIALCESVEPTQIPPPPPQLSGSKLQCAPGSVASD